MLAVVLNVSPDSLSKETLMIDLNVLSSPVQPQQTVPIEQGLEACREHFNHLLSEVLHAPHQEAPLVEAAIFKQLMQLGLLYSISSLSIISWAIMAQRSKPPRD